MSKPWSETIRECKEGKWSKVPDNPKDLLQMCKACDRAANKYYDKGGIRYFFMPVEVCNYCPIKEYTGLPLCKGSPFENLKHFLNSSGPKDSVTIERYRQEEVEFLDKVEKFCIEREIKDE